MEYKIMKVFKEWKKNTGYNYMMLFKFNYSERVLYILHKLKSEREE